MKSRLLLLAWLACSILASAQIRVSTNYSMTAETVDGGGGPATSSSYGHLNSVGLIAGRSTSVAHSLELGYLAMTSSPLSGPDIAVFAGASTSPAVERQSNIGTLTFPDTFVGANSAAQTFTIQNTGTATLNNLALSKVGANPGVFILGSLGATTLAPNATTSFTATFSPTAAGAGSAVLQIASNDPDENPFIINLAGNGLAPTVTLGNLSQTYDGTVKSATATTNPAGLNVILTYNGSSNAPTNAGTYTVVGTINDANYAGSASGTLVIIPAMGTVTLGNLSRTYDGAVKSATATTSPAGLNVIFTYDGSATVPTNAGSYAVVGTINHTNYTGTASGTLVIGKATVTLGNLIQPYDGTARIVSATTAQPGPTVNLTYNGAPTAPTNAGSYTVIATINDPNYVGMVTQTLVIVRFRTANPMSAARYGHTATVLPNGKVLLAAGAGSAGNTAELFDPSTGTCTPTGTLGTFRYGPTATLLPNGKVLVTGGYNGGHLATAELYDPATGTWAATGSMGASRSQHTATLLPNGKVLIAGGYNGGYLASVELYDPATGMWAATGALSVAGQQHTATLLPNGFVLLAGGVGISGPLAGASIFNPGTGTWTPTGTLNFARQKHTATLLPNGKVLVAGGLGTSLPLVSTELYDPVTGNWTLAAALHSARQDHMAALLPNGQLLVTGGYNGGYLLTAELYDPASGLWSVTSPLTFARQQHTATLLPDGKVLLAGGLGSSGALNSTELYDTSGGVWALAGSPLAARTQHTATLLPNGKVLVAGGYNSGGNLTSAELYDPASGNWSATGAMVGARYGHVATLLQSGKVLIAGGYNAGYLATAELYDPATGVWTTTGVMGKKRQEFTATLLPNGKVLVAGGYNAGYLNNAEIFNPATGTWTATALLVTPRSQHTATLLPSGLVLVTGGLNAGSAIANAELYDSSTGTWATTAPLTEVRRMHTATLLPNGQLLVAGGYGAIDWLFTASLYNPTSGTWVATGGPSGSRFLHTATLTLNGQVLITGGRNGGGDIAGAEIYDPVSGVWSTTGLLGTARSQHTATLLPNGQMLAAGGTNGANTLVSAERCAYGLGFSTAWRPQVSVFTSPLSIGSGLILTGSGFRGISGASGGNSQDSSSDYPVVQLRSLESGQTKYLHTQNWSVNSYASTSVTGMPSGWTMATMFVNGIPGNASILNIGPTATVTLSSLSQTYDGTPKSVTATTTPSGLGVGFTYNGSATPPTTAGSYAVVATVTDATYSGSATGTLVISKAAATVTLSNLSQAYNGAAKSATVTTTPGGLTVSLTYNGSTTLPIGIGYYTVVGTAIDANYAGSATNTFVIFSVGQSEGIWTTVAPMTTPRWGSASGAINGVLYIAGGYNGSHQFTVDAYNPATNTWSAKTSLPGYHTSAASGVINGILYLAGGTNNSTFINTVRAFDPVANTWTAKTSTLSLRSQAAGGVLNGLLYVAGGYNSGGSLGTLEAYDPAGNTWSTKAAMPTARSGLAMGVVNGILYAVGGVNAANLPINTVEAYNPATNSWTTKAPMPTARLGLAVVALNDTLYAIGGSNSTATTIYSTVEAYDPEHDLWTTLAPLNVATSTPNAVSINNLIYVSGGNAGAAGAVPTTEYFTLPVTTGAASSITPSTTSLNGSVNPAGNTVPMHFEYGATTTYGTSTAIQNATGSSSTPVATPVTGLAPGTVYHFRLVGSFGGAWVRGQDQVFTTPPSFSSWSLSKFTGAELTNPAISGPKAVFGQDGLPNLVKYALGLEPKTNITTGLPVLGTLGSDWTYTYTRPDNITDVNYTVVVSTNLTAWTTAGVTHELVSTSGGFATWRGRYPQAAGAKIFFLLKVTLP